MTASRACDCARLVPELLCTGLAGSLAFYVDLCGFRIAYDRPEDGFAYLDLEGAQLMLEEADPADTGERIWWTARPERPFGRGINLQIEVASVDAIHARLVAAGWPLYRPIEEAWYRAGDRETGNRQFLVQDPDGYLLRFFSDLGVRPVAADPGA
jgi:catechol 2,3-dioxygenase-like lactoylglutathione lyase family enzyme